MRKSALAIGLLASAAASPVWANDDVKKAIADPNNWAMQQGNYEGWRYSRLDQINTSNVKDLKVAWQFSTGVLRGHEGSPLVIGKDLYLHSAFPNKVFKLSLENPVEPKIVWKYEPKQDPSVIPVMCCDTVNRGPQIAGNTLIMGLADTTIVALDTATGKEKWKQVNGDPKKGETYTGNLIIANDKVIMGTSGAEFGVRCHVTAYSLAMVRSSGAPTRWARMPTSSSIRKRPCRSASRSARTRRSRPGRATSGRSVAARPGASTRTTRKPTSSTTARVTLDLEPGTARRTGRQAYRPEVVDDDFRP